jgi:hypothetical protein
LWRLRRVGRRRRLRWIGRLRRFRRLRRFGGPTLPFLSADREFVRPHRLFNRPDLRFLCLALALARTPSGVLAA